MTSVDVTSLHSVITPDNTGPAESTTLLSPYA